MAVKETHFVPSKFTKIGIPAPDHVISLKVGLTNKRFPELEKHLYEGMWSASTSSGFNR